jgi:hypothetical protein
MGAGMAASAVLGVWMAMSNSHRRRTALLVLAAGAALPALVLAL